MFVGAAVAVVGNVELLEVEVEVGRAGMETLEALSQQSSLEWEQHHCPPPFAGHGSMKYPVSASVDMIRQYDIFSSELQNLGHSVLPQS